MTAKLTTLAQNSVIVQCMVSGRWKSYRSWRTGLRMWCSGVEWLFICLELQRGKVTSTYEGGEKDYTKHNAVAALVTSS